MILPWFLIVVFLILSYLVKTTIKPKNYPPGPRWYPFFGCNNILFRRSAKSGKSQWHVISEMAKEYNTNVLGLKMGNENIVVAFGEDNIRQVSNDKEFEARPDNFFLRLRCFGKRIGITFVDNPLWKEHRTFTFKSMKAEGFGKTVMHEEIKETLKDLFNFIDSHNGDPLNMNTMVSMAITNILWKFTAGEHIKDAQLKRIVELMTARSQAFTMAGGWLNQWPWLRFIAPEWTGYNVIINMNKELSDIIEESIVKHKKGLVEGNDLIYIYLEEIRQRKQTYTEDQLKGICLDFLIAATQTTGSSFGFVILALLYHEDLQEKMYQEIITVLGDGEPSWVDFGRLVLVQAFYYEVQRYFTIALFSGARRTVSDVDIDGYTVPAGTTVLVSLGDLHSDPQHWDEPDKFKPERFIDANGNLKPSAYLHPFGLGRRRCPGEPLSRAFMLTALVQLIKTYKIKTSNGVLPPDEPIVGILAEPQPFTARFMKRI